MTRRTRIVSIAFALLLSGCSGEPLTAPTVSANQVVASVTPAIAALLDGNGRFVFGEPAPADVPWISADRARELAVAYWQSYSHSQRPQLAKKRKAGIAEHLTPCRRVFLAESAYEPFAPEFNRNIRRTFGAMWMVSFCSGGEQQVAIAVSVENTDLVIDSIGDIDNHQSGDFWSEAVPVGTNFPLEPELGTVDVAERMGPRVAALPRYRRLAQRYNVFSGLWTYQVESSVTVRGARSGIDIDTNGVGYARVSSMYDLRAVMANQDSVAKSRSEFFTMTDDGLTWRTGEAFRRVDVPVSLETFAIVRNP